MISDFYYCYCYFLNNGSSIYYIGKNVVSRVYMCVLISSFLNIIIEISEANYSLYRRKTKQNVSNYLILIDTTETTTLD